MTSKADIILIAPELSDVSDATFDLAIADSEIIIGNHGSRTDIIKRYYSAHCLAVWTASSVSAGGAVSSEKAGRVAVSYSVPSMDKGFLAVTKYGQMVMELMKFKKPTPFAV